MNNYETTLALNPLCPPDSRPLWTPENGKSLLTHVVEIHLAHGDIEQGETELLSALDCSKEQREGSDTATGVPENWLPPGGGGSLFAF